MTSEGRLGPKRVSSFYEAYFGAPEPIRPSRPLPAGPRLAADGDRRRAYVLAAIEDEAGRVASTPQGARNHALNRGAYRLGRLVPVLHPDEVREAMTAAGEASGLTGAEIAATIESGLAAGMKNPREIPEAVELVEFGWSPDEDEFADFWSARPELDLIHRWARARRASPWAVLGCVLMRVLTAVHVSIVLPALVGAAGSLNGFLALVGASGAGKGSAEGCADELLILPRPITVERTGSGEGIAHAYMRRVKGGVEQHTTNVLFSVPEIDTLGALSARRGSTLLGELRSAWSGERLGFAYADPTRRLPVPAHGYRLCLVAGVQPARAFVLLDDVDAGTPQRFVWLPASDPAAPDEVPGVPDRLTWKHPTWSANTFGGRHAMKVCPTAVTEIDEARLDTLRGSGEAIRGHQLLCQLKVAASFALLDQRLDVTDQDWLLAEKLMQVSDRTRAAVQAVLSTAGQQANQAKAIAEAERLVLVDERRAEAALVQLVRRLVSLVGRNTDGLRRNEIRRQLGAGQRELLDQALDQAVAQGQLDEVDVVVRGKEGRRFVRSTRTN